jgi:hypothetical protein
MKKILALIGGLIAFSLHGQSTVNFSAGPGQRDVRTVTGQPVMIGTAAIGFFDNDVWYQYGITDIREIFGEPGRFAGVAFSNDPIFPGQQIFLAINSGEQGGLYTSSLDNWVFPDRLEPFPANTTSINTSEIDTAIYGFFNDSHVILAPEPPVSHVLTVFFLILLGLYLIGNVHAKRN